MTYLTHERVQIQQFNAAGRCISSNIFDVGTVEPFNLHTLMYDMRVTKCASMRAVLTSHRGSNKRDRVLLDRTSAIAMADKYTWLETFGSGHRWVAVETTLPDGTLYYTFDREDRVAPHWRVVE